MASLRWRGERKLTSKFQVKVGGSLIDDDGLRLHLGCGPIDLKGWVNIDAEDFSHVHLRVDGFGLESFGEASASVVYACHCLEHLRDDELAQILLGVHRVLRPEGLFLISVPDFEVLVRAYLAGGDIREIRGAVLGGMDHLHNFHFQLFDQKVLSELLEKFGFVVHDRWETKEIFGKDLGDWSSYTQRVGKDVEGIRLNISATRA